MQNIEGSSRRKNSANRGGIGSKKNRFKLFCRVCTANVIKKIVKYDVSPLSLFLVVHFALVGFHHFVICANRDTS